MADYDASLLGRKIFFLYPPAFVVDNIIEELIQQDLETYIVKDESKLQRALRKYSDSIVLACINETLPPAQRETWIKQIMNDKAIRGVDIGVISSLNDDNTRALFLKTYNVSCGFFPLKMDSEELLKALLNMLEAAEAKGRRKYIRIETKTDAKTTINLPLKDGDYVIGQILDISAVGLSCVFSSDPKLGKNSLLPNLQIKLQTTLVTMDGIVFGSRTEKVGSVYVILFTPNTHPSSRKKIRTFIQKKLQSNLDGEIR